MPSGRASATSPAICGVHVEGAVTSAKSVWWGRRGVAGADDSANAEATALPPAEVARAILELERKTWYNVLRIKMIIGVP